MLYFSSTARKGIPNRRLLRGVLSDDNIELIKEFLWNGLTLQSIARAFNIDRWTIERIKNHVMHRVPTMRIDSTWFAVSKNIASEYVKCAEESYSSEQQETDRIYDNTSFDVKAIRSVSLRRVFNKITYSKNIVDVYSENNLQMENQ